MTKLILILGSFVGAVAVLAMLYTTRPQPIPDAPPSTTITAQEESQLPSENSRGVYLDFSPEVFAATSGQTRVLFFHAPWCPTCKAANEEFTNREQEIPAGVVLLKTDYDSEKELRQKYAITYQHTFVEVDENGDEVQKWNGGGVEELRERMI